MLRYGSRPSRGFLQEHFIGPNYDRVKAVKGQRESHLNLLGGKYCVPQDLNVNFIFQYSKDVDAGMDIKHCLTEVVSPISAFFIDLDVMDTESTPADWNDDPAKKTEMVGWCKTAVRAISKVLVQQVREDEDDNLPCTSQLQRTLKTISRLPVGTAAIAFAPPRMVIKNGIAATKIGVHIVWPNLIVSKQTARRLRDVVVVDMDEAFPTRDWPTIIDITVYRDKASLRMLWSHKVRPCHGCCDSVVIKTAKKTEFKLRQSMIAEFGLPAGAGQMAVARVVSAAYNKEKHDRHKIFLEAVKASNDCGVCRGKMRMCDTDAGFYVLRVVLGSDGEVLDDITDAACADSFFALALCSVRRDEGIAETEVSIPKGLPALEVKVQKRKADALFDGDEVSDTEDVQVVESSFSTRYVQKPLMQPESVCKFLIEKWIRSGEFGKAYELVQVAHVVRLEVSSKPSDKMLDGSNEYIVVANLKGYGSQYCHGIAGEHTSNHVYFQFTSNGKCCQRCHSKNDPKCKKACTPSSDVPPALYTALFPYTATSCNVMKEEIRDWVSGKTPASFLHDLGIIHCKRNDNGTSFKVVVGNYRKKKAREAKKLNGGMYTSNRADADAPNTNPENDPDCILDFDMYDL
jgi:hypothetical protein